MPGEATLTRTPHETQVFCRALLDSGSTYRSIRKLTRLSESTIAAIAKRHDYKIESVEAVRKRLPLKFLNLSDEALNHISSEKLAICSAPQLAMVAGIAVDKMRDMEGSNRPVFNIVDIAMNLTKTIAEAKQRKLALETHLIDSSDLK